MTVEEIKDTYSMRDIVERYGFQPNRRGFIPCPFHEGDRQASLKVYDRDFHCHSCGANGDIFTFIQMIDNIGFRDAFIELGGSYQGDKKLHAAQIARRKRERELRRREEELFKAWKFKILSEVCRLLRMYDVLEKLFEPLSEEWIIVINRKQLLEEDYKILVFGTSEEQKEMRDLE